MTVKSFKPEIDNQTKILILGTMLGEASLAADKYYAHPRNAFWKIMADVLNNGKPFENYTEKLNCLKAHHIGLWDNLKYCERKGSLDSDIKEEYPNDIAEMLKKHPSIEQILLNGKKSEAFFKKYQSALLPKINVRTMPSTSPANARLSYDKKCEIWKDSLLEISGKK